MDKLKPLNVEEVKRRFMMKYQREEQEYWLYKLFIFIIKRYNIIIEWVMWRVELLKLWKWKIPNKLPIDLEAELKGKSQRMWNYRDMY
jgi:hypothetical protein